jgi:hypothetical protein
VSNLSLTSRLNTNRAFIVAGNALQVAPPGNGLFSDPFDGTVLDTVYRWNSPVLAGAGAVTIANGSCSLTVGTGASSAAAVSSIETFISQGTGFIAAGSVISLEASPSINTHRFMGEGTPNPSFTAATPLQDAVGYEFDITGSFNACIYQAGVRVFRLPIPLPPPTPLGNITVLAAYYRRPDATFFFFGDLEDSIVTVPLIAPAFNALPYRIHLINGTSGPAVSPTWSSGAVGTIDTGNNYPVVWNGQILTRARSPGKFINVNGLSIATETTVWTPASGRRFRLMGYNLTGTGAQNIVLKDNTAGTTIMVIPGVTAGQLNFCPSIGNGIISAAPNNVLTANAGGANAISGYFFGTEE